MLRVARLTDPDGRYYAADLASGIWVGAGAQALGLAQSPDRRSFRAILSGRDPRTERPLRVSAVRVTAFDLTFAAPKSVSVAAALGDQDVTATVRAAHRAAVAGALSYLEARALTVRVGTGEERQVVPAGTLVGAQFEHTTSRALDPHLHSHVVVANLASPSDGSWRAVDGRGLYAHARAAGALYEAQLRHLIGEELGVGWTRRASGTYELAAVDPSVIGAFSTRRAEILEHLFDRGTPPAEASSKARRVAWAATRDPKACVGPSEHAAAWRRRAASLGLHGIDGRGRDRRGEHGRAAGAEHRRWERLDEHRFVGSIFERERTGVARRDVVAAWAGALRGGASATDVDACVASVAPWGHRAGVAEQRRPMTDVVARGWELASLGPRPSEPRALATWRAAASELDRYRTRWGIDDPRDALGTSGSPAELSSMPARRLADHLEASRVLAEARRRLERDAAIGHDARVLQPLRAPSLER